MRQQWSLFVAGIVGAAGLVAPVGSAAAHAGLVVGRPAAAVKSVTRAYGDAPVRLANKRQQLALTFTGHHGDRVDLLDPDYFPGTLCGRVTLIRAGRPITRNSLAHWRLPRNGSYTLRFTPRERPCNDSQRPGRLRLTQVELVHPGAEPTRLPARRGVIYAVQARVPATGMVNVATSPDDPGFVAEVLDGEVRHFGLATEAGISAGLPRVAEMTQFLLRPGAGALSFTGEWWGVPIPGAPTSPLEALEGRRSEAGDRVVLLHPGGASVGSWRPVYSSTTYDGPALATTTQPDSFGQPQVLTFEGTAGSFLDPQDGTESHGDNYATALLGPDGQTIRRQYYGGPLQLTSSGTHSLVFLPSSQAVDASARLRAAGVTMLPAMRTDGVPTRFAAPEPGRMVMAPTTLFQYLRIHATHPDGPTAAFGFSDPARRPDCSKSTSNSCGDNNFVAVTSAGSPSGGGLHPGWVFVRFALSESGPIDLNMAAG